MIKKNLFCFSLIFLSLIFLPFISAVTTTNAELQTSVSGYNITVNHMTTNQINITSNDILLTTILTESMFTNNEAAPATIKFISLIEPNNDIKYQDGTITTSDSHFPIYVEVTIPAGTWIVIGNFDEPVLDKLNTAIVKYLIGFVAMIILIFALIIFINALRDDSKFFSVGMVIYYSTIFLIVTFMYIALINYLITLLP